MKFALLLVALITSVWSAHAAPVAGTEKPKVLLEEIKPLEDKHRVIVPVKVEAQVQSLVSADIEGHVTRILKPLGSVVKRGEVVLFLENKDPGFTYAAVPVRSPIDGVISQLFISQMTKAVRGDKLFSVIDPKKMKLSAEFPSHEIGLMTPGLVGSFKIESAKDVAISVRIVGISPLVDARTGTASAELEFVDPSVVVKKPSADPKSAAQPTTVSHAKTTLPPIGSVGQAVFEINQGSILMIPEASLIYQNGQPMVRVLKGANQVDRKPIELGEQRDSSYVVKSGIAKGDRIVVRSSRPLKENELIEIEAAPVKTQ